jgi:mono/diheme cytochrome c family protein
VRNLSLTFAGVMLAAAICTAAEKPSAEHVKLMKDLGAANGAIRKGADVAANAAKMQETMKAVTKYWASKSEAAKKACDDGNAGVAAILKAGEDKAALAAGMKMVGGSCKGCHDAHREKVSDTEYLIK